MKKVPRVLNSNKFLVAFIVLVGLLFYWYSFRPAHIREKCSEKANESFYTSGSVYDLTYKQCLNRSGL